MDIDNLASVVPAERFIGGVQIWEYNHPRYGFAQAVIGHTNLNLEDQQNVVIKFNPVLVEAVIAQLLAHGFIRDDSDLFQPKDTKIAHFWSPEWKLRLHNKTHVEWENEQS